MNGLRRYLGFVWMLIGPLVILLLLQSAVRNIDVAGKSDINKPLPWLIIILVFTPIAVGLTIFGWYSWKGAYDEGSEPL
jgi:uncharacterized Tic20 family protein